jgi:hypothetical protein
MTGTPDDANRQFEDREGPAAQWFIPALAAFVWMWILFPPQP